MGGELRIIMCGSAPLSADTQTFIRDCLNVHVLQGYGLTETTACATYTDSKSKCLKMDFKYSVYHLKINCCLSGLI